MKSVKFNPLTSLVMAAALAIGLAGCGGSSNEKSAAELEMERLAAEEMSCEAAGGRWNDDNTCTSADEREMEAAQMNCEAGGGRYESDGSCTSAADVAAAQLEADEMACEGAGGQWNADNTCTSAADLALAGLEMVCNDAGGRWESDNTCTSAADLQLERAEMACTGADGRWNADNTCTSAAELAEMACTDDDGRWNANGTCTSAAELAEMECTDDDGRWNADGTCTSAAELVTERQMACTDAGGRWNGDTADDMCSDATELADEQRTDINGKIEAAQKAVDAVNDDSSDAMVTAADDAVAAASMAIKNAANIDDSEKAAFNSAVGAIQSNLATRKSSRQMAMDSAEKTANEAMAATAAKLYAGISAQMGAGDGSTFTANDRDAFYNTGATAISVVIGDGTNAPTAVSATLSEDKDADVPDNYGWEGKKYTRTTPASEGMYEAVVYSNVGDPVEGEPFDMTYTLTNDMVAVDTSDTTDGDTRASRVRGSMFDHTAGVKRFPLPDPNRNSATVVTVDGFYHGVFGTYRCTPGASAVCAVNVAGDGFRLGTVPSATDSTFTDGGGGWMFEPSNPKAKVMSAPDNEYASYGWWIHKTENDMTYTASAFVDERGTVPAAAGLDALNGEATYEGGAAGKYALSSSTGGTNDAGHFTAKVILEANFTTNDGTVLSNAIDGTIGSFMVYPAGGTDGEMRNWTVKLNGSDIGDTGGIGNAGDGTTNVGTVWTIDETAAAASGNWTGTLRDNGTDGVPQVATGTFFSEYKVGGGSTEGSMVGAFGANKCSNC